MPSPDKALSGEPPQPTEVARLRARLGLPSEEDETKDRERHSLAPSPKHSVADGKPMDGWHSVAELRAELRDLGIAPYAVDGIRAGRDFTTRGETAPGHIRNCLQVLQGGARLPHSAPGVLLSPAEYEAVTRLLRAVLAELERGSQLEAPKDATKVTGLEAKADPQ